MAASSVECQSNMFNNFTEIEFNVQELKLNLRYINRIL